MRKDFFKKNAGLIFNEKLKLLVEQKIITNETRKFIKEGKE